MGDIWSGLGVDIGKDEGEWLYKIGSDVRGPMPHRMLVEKLLQGEIDLGTPVAREGTDFHPLHAVAAFAPHLENARIAMAKRNAKKVRKQVAMVALPVLLAVFAVVLYLRFQVQKRQREETARVAAALAVKPPPPPDTSKLPQMGLVALVSLGSESDVKIHHEDAAAPEAKSKRKAKHAARMQHNGPEGPEEPEEEVQSCKLTQQDIFGTLRSALSKLNVCVEDEKKRDTQGLLPASLELQFVVKPNGRVTDFAINDRHYRTGPLNNCMIKAFNTISFPSSTGANCPITIPIKIGK